MIPRERAYFLGGIWFGVDCMGWSCCVAIVVDHDYVLLVEDCQLCIFCVSCVIPCKTHKIDLVPLFSLDLLFVSVLTNVPELYHVSRKCPQKITVAKFRVLNVVSLMALELACTLES